MQNVLKNPDATPAQVAAYLLPKLRTSDGSPLRLAYAESVVGAWIDGVWKPIAHKTIINTFPWVVDFTGRDYMINGEPPERVWVEVFA